MTTVEAIDKIRKLLFGEQMPAPIPAPEKMATDCTLKDGTVVSIDKLEVGGAVTIAGAPAPDGNHVLEDGTTISVANGLITEVATAAAEAGEGEAAKVVPPAPVMMTQQEMEAALQKFAEGAAPDQQGIVVILRALFESVFGWELRQAKEKAIRDQAIQVYQNGFSKQQEGLKELVSLVEKMASFEVANPEEAETDWEKMTPLQKFRATK